QPATMRHSVTKLRAELGDVEHELERLADVIAATGPVDALLSGIASRQARREELQQAITRAELTTRRQFNRHAIADTVRDVLAGRRELLTSTVQDQRQLLRETLVGPLRFTPEGKMYRFEGEVAIGRLLAGRVGLPPFVASPSGFEPEFWP